MEEGEYFAIETFGSTGRGRVIESVSEQFPFASPSGGETNFIIGIQGDCSHYAKIRDPRGPLR